jgi:hypothetical protein
MLIRLANPEHMLPWPGVPGRIISGDEVAEINPAHPFWNRCLQDGSIIPVPLAPDDARPLAGEPGPAVVETEVKPKR